jgi:cytochrome c oxidase assembly factor CtaG
MPLSIGSVSPGRRELAMAKAALENEAVHALEHAMLLGSAMLFWWILLRPSSSKEARYTVAIPYLFTTILHSSVIGALIMFSYQAWYPYYASLTPAWGLTPLEDQQVAGLIMWVPAGFIFTGLTIGYFAAWLRALEKRHAP